MTTVQDILQIADLDLRLLAGQGSVGNHVRWVHVAEDPEALDSLKGGELLLTSGQRLGADSDGQREYARRLVDAGVAGLGFSPGGAFPEVPATLVSAAAELELPLFEVPQRIALNAITEAVMTRIVHEQFSLLQRSLAVQEKLTKIILEEEGLGEVLNTLAALVPCVAVLFDFHGTVLGETSSRRGLSAETVPALWALISDRRASRAPFSLDFAGGANREAEVFPVVAGHRIGAFLAVLRASGEFGEHDRIVLNSVVTAIALELVKRKAVVETEKRLIGDFLDQLAAGGLSDQEIGHRLTFFGLDPESAHAVLVVDACERGGGEGGATLSARLRDRLHASVDEFMAERRLPCISAAQEERVVVLLQSAEGDESTLRSLGEAFLQWAEDELAEEASICVGVGRPYARLAELRRSYWEASYAVRFRQARTATGFVADRRDLGSYALLLSLQDTPSLEVFCDSLLGRLVEHDREHASDLLSSLASFLEANGHWGDAAEKLFVHRHTLRYRIGKVQEITGRDLSCPEDRMDFWLAIKTREFLAELSEGGPKT